MSVNLYKNGELTRLALNTPSTKQVSTTNDGYVPRVTDTEKFLKGDGTWDTPDIVIIDDVEPGSEAGTIQISKAGKSYTVRFTGLGDLAFSSQIIPTNISELTNTSNFQTEDTWRPVVDNTDSDLDLSSLSANQGRVLKEAADLKSGKEHSHSVSDITNFPSAMPASDVSRWAKTELKPGYTASEVGAHSSKTYVPTITNEFYPSSQLMSGIAIQKAISSAMDGIIQFNYKIVKSLPETGVRGTVYFIPKPTDEGYQMYEEYIYLNKKWEVLASDHIDLSDYYTKEESNNAIKEMNDTIDNHTSEAIDDLKWVGLTDEYEETSETVEDGKFVFLTDELGPYGIKPVPISIIEGLFRK